MNRSTSPSAQPISPTDILTWRQYLDILFTYTFRLQIYEPQDWLAEFEWDRKKAWAMIRNYVVSNPQLELKLNDPHLLSKLAAILKQQMQDIDLEKFTGNIPPDLDQLMADLEKHQQKKAEEVKAIKKRTLEKFVHLDPETEKAYEEMVKVIQKQLKTADPESSQEHSLVIADKIIDQIPQVVSPPFFDQAVKPDEFQKIWQKTVVVYTARAGIKTPDLEQIKTIADNTYEKSIPVLAASPKKTIDYSKTVPAIPKADLDRYLSQKAKIEKTISGGLKTSRLVKLPSRQKEVSNQKITPLISRTLESALRTNPPRNYSDKGLTEWLEQNKGRVNEIIFRTTGSSLPTDKELSEFIVKIAPELTDPLKVMTDRFTAIPLQAQENMTSQVPSQIQWPAYPLRQPKMVWLYLKSFLVTPLEKTIVTAVDQPLDKAEIEEFIQLKEKLPLTFAEYQKTGLSRRQIVDRLPPEVFAEKSLLARRKVWRAITDGWTVERADSLLETFKKAGLNESDPWVQNMAVLRQRLLPVHNLPASQLTKIYHQVKTNTGFFQEIRTFFPSLRQAPKSISEPIVRFITGHRYASFHHLFSNLYQKTVGRVLETFKKSGLGKTIASQTTKASVWLGEKLGIQLGGKLALKKGISKIFKSIAMAPLGPVVKTVLFVASLAANLVKKLLSRLKIDLKEPKKALLYVLGGAGAIILIPGAAGLIVGGPLIFLGGAGLIGFGGTAAGSAVTGIAGGTSSVITAFLTAPAAAPIGLFVAGTLGGVAFLSFFIFMVVSGAFILPINPYDFALPQALFQVTKTADDTEIENYELPQEVKYQIQIKAQSDTEIEITSITDQRSVYCQDPNVSPHFPSQTLNPPSDEIKIWETSYQFTFDSDFEDCLACDTITVVANVVDGPTNQIVSAAQCVAIGDAPKDCPLIWPTIHGPVGQGPNTPYELDRDKCTSHYGQEAIDVSLGGHPPLNAVATHDGTVITSGEADGYGQYVIIQGVCRGNTFYTHYYHLSARYVKEKDEVDFLDPIGRTGNTGKSTGHHLHYEFVGNNMPMAPPNIPQTVPQACCGVCGSCLDQPCNVDWSSYTGK